MTLRGELDTQKAACAKANEQLAATRQRLHEATIEGETQAEQLRMVKANNLKLNVRSNPIRNSQSNQFNLNLHPITLTLSNLTLI